MSSKHRDILFNMFNDINDFAKLKNIHCPPIYITGRAGCLLANYLDKSTTDIDILDMNYTPEVARLFRILDNLNLMDLYITSTAPDFINRTVHLNDFDFINLNILSLEDIIISKLGRYNMKDKEDIEKLIEKADKTLLNTLINTVIERNDFSERIKSIFIENVKIIKEQYNV